MGVLNEKRCKNQILEHNILKQFKNKLKYKITQCYHHIKIK